MADVPEEVQATSVEAQAAATEAPVEEEGVEEAPAEEAAPVAEPTVAEIKVQLETERAKLARAVEAEKKVRIRAQGFESELGTFRQQAEAAEAERQANLTLEQRLSEAQARADAADVARQKALGELGEFKVVTALSEGGFLAGLDGEARTAQLETLKALTSLAIVQEDGQFSLERFESRFGAMKPAAPVAAPVVAQPVVDLGGKTTPPSEAKQSRVQALLEQHKVARGRGLRSEVIAIERELGALTKGK